jgi:hypothetical protein
MAQSQLQKIVLVAFYDWYKLVMPKLAKKTRKLECKKIIYAKQLWTVWLERIS